MGLQASMLDANSVITQTMCSIMYFPAWPRLAEIAWVRERRMKLGTLSKGLVNNYTAHLKQKGVVYARSMYNIHIDISRQLR